MDFEPWVIPLAMEEIAELGTLYLIPILHVTGVVTRQGTTSGPLPFQTTGAYPQFCTIHEKAGSECGRQRTNICSIVTRPLLF